MSLHKGEAVAKKCFFVTASLFYEAVYTQQGYACCINKLNLLVYAFQSIFG